MADGGYDVADYRDIEPVVRHARRGRAAHRRGARAGHPRSSSTWCRTTAPTSSAWFQAALAAGPGSAERERFWFRDGRGATASCRRTTGSRSSAAPPGPTRPDGRRASGTCTCSPPSSRTSTGTNPEVRRGVRRHPAVLVRPRRRRHPDRLGRRAGQGPGLRRLARTPYGRYTDRDEVHDDLPGLARGRRRVRASRRPDRRGLAARPGAVRPLPAPGRAAHRVQLRLPGLPVGRRRRCARRSTAPSPRTRRSAPRRPGCCPTTTSIRHVTRYGRADTSFGQRRPRGHGAPVDLELGTRRARAAALLAMALPGSRLRLPGRGARPARGRGHPGRAAPGPDAGTVPAAPIRGRDGCRVPLPWSGDEPPFGFGPRGRRSRGCRSRRAGRGHRRGPGRGPGLDAEPLPPRPARPPR